jgi:hypothetical protein
VRCIANELAGEGAGATGINRRHSTLAADAIAHIH